MGNQWETNGNPMGICILVTLYKTWNWMEFQQISFVNGINTNKGGKHVEYIINQS